MDRLNQISNEQLEKLELKFDFPLHLYFHDRIKENAAAYIDTAMRLYPATEVCFAVKSNPCRGAIRAAAGAGLGVDVVSEFELRTALQERIKPEKIICNGNAKSDIYLEEAARSGVKVVVDSEWEMEILNMIGGEINRTVPVLIRFTGMPLEGLTSAEQSTASSWTKFGFPVKKAEAVFNFVSQMTNLELQGISAHIGTQICDPTGYDRLLVHLLEIAEYAQSRSLAINYIDIGGGFPVSYMEREDWQDFRENIKRQMAGDLPENEWVTWDNISMGVPWSNISRKNVDSNYGNAEEDMWWGKAYYSEFPGTRMFERLLTHKDEDDITVIERLQKLGSPTLIIEPGRGLIGTAGITIARVAGVKHVMGNKVVIADLGIVNHGTNLITHDIFPVEVRPEMENSRPVEAFIGGRLCFTGDMISKIKVRLNRMPGRGDLLLIHHTGTYSADHFASNSCGFPRPAKVAIMSDGKFEVWRRRENFNDVFPRLI